METLEDKQGKTHIEMLRKRRKKEQTDTTTNKEKSYNYIIETLRKRTKKST